MLTCFAELRRVLLALLVLCCLPVAAQAQSCTNQATSSWTLNPTGSWYSIGGTGIGHDNNMTTYSVTTASQTLSGVASTGSMISTSFKFINGNGGIAGNNVRVDFSYAGTVYARVTTPAYNVSGNARLDLLGGATATVNGSTVATGTTPFASGTGYAFVINLPAGVPTSGALTMTITKLQSTDPAGATDDVYLDNIFFGSSVCGDLRVTKSDGVTTVAPGAVVTYTITVAHLSGNSVSGVVLRDPAITGLTVTAVACSALASNHCVAGSTLPTVAQLQAGYGLPTLYVGRYYELLVTATVGSGLPGGTTLPNVATITPPASFTDTNSANNSATDTDTVTSTANFAITKTDGQTQVTSGANTTYTIVVTNGGTGSVVGAILADPAATGLTKVSVSCAPTPGTCVTPPTVAQLESGSFALPLMTSGQTYQIRVVATATATSGTVTNTATVTVPSGTTDGNLANNTASDGDTVILPLVAAKTSAAYSDPVNGIGASAKMIPGGFVTYTITVTNPNLTAVGVGTVSVTDVTAPNLTFYANDIGSVGSGPALFNAGSPSSGLSYAFAGLASTTDRIEFSSNNGSTWTYVPVPDAQGVDAGVTTVRINPTGTMNPNTSFSVQLRYRVN